MKKKLMVLLIAICLVSLLSACGKEDSPALEIDPIKDMKWRLNFFLLTGSEEFREKVGYVLLCIPIAGLMAFLALASERANKYEDFGKWFIIMFLIGTTVLFIPLLTGYGLLYGLPEDLQLSEISSRLKWPQSSVLADWAVKTAYVYTLQIPSNHSQWQLVLFATWVICLLATLFTKTTRPIVIPLAAIAGWFLFPHLFNELTLSLSQTIPNNPDLETIYVLNSSYMTQSFIMKWLCYLGPPVVTLVFALLPNFPTYSWRDEDKRRWKVSPTELLAGGAAAALPEPPTKVREFGEEEGEEYEPESDDYGLEQPESPEGEPLGFGVDTPNSDITPEAKYFREEDTLTRKPEEEFPEPEEESSIPEDESYLPEATEEALEPSFTTEEESSEQEAFEPEFAVKDEDVLQRKDSSGLEPAFKDEDVLQRKDSSGVEAEPRESDSLSRRLGKEAVSAGLRVAEAYHPEVLPLTEAVRRKYLGDSGRKAVLTRKPPLDSSARDKSKRPKPLAKKKSSSILTRKGAKKRQTTEGPPEGKNQSSTKPKVEGEGKK